MRTPMICSSRPTAIALVGEPMIVPSPPTEAAKAMPSGSAPDSPSLRSAPTPPAPSTASAIGIMISAVEVFEIEVDRSAVANMNASSSRVGPPWRPIALRMPTASRQCRLVRSIASARNAPPRIRNIVGE
jgi:hypothetical protein